MYFLAWLYLVCGVSQSNCRIARDFIVSIAQMIAQSRTKVNLHQDILNDVRSITKRMDLNPVIDCYACCPKCYSLYDIEYGPPECGYQERPTTKVCATEIFVTSKLIQLPVIEKVSSQKIQYTKLPRLKRPHSVFVVHPMKDWIKWFLSLDTVEDAIDNWAKEVNSFPIDPVVDYQQSAAWKKIYPTYSASNTRKATPPPLNLAFSLFIDWFNPLGNKISGRQLSIGIVALNCMNLPPDMRQKPENTFLSGVVPAPGQPDMTTITHILTPLVDELIQLDKGFSVPTPRYPKGRKVTVRLGCLIGDIVATHKVAGFTSHAGRLFCTWCHCLQKDVGTMMIARLRDRRSVLDAAHRWKECQTVKARDDTRRATGVRWSELNRLEYWDPVKSVGLGIMHNWFEGVLQHHFRYRWAFENNKDGSNEVQSTDDESNTNQPSGPGWLSEAMIKKILKNLQQVIVPQGTTRVPKGLGTKANGKLKASEWHSLFATHLPLAALDVFIGDYGKFSSGDSGPLNDLIFENFVALVECTHIIGARKVTSSDSKRFGEIYQQYTSTSVGISEDIKIVPNHHYALHTPAQMQWYGPLLSVSEFPRERLIGMLQKMHTDGKMGTS